MSVELFGRKMQMLSPFGRAYYETCSPYETEYPPQEHHAETGPEKSDESFDGAKFDTSGDPAYAVEVYRFIVVAIDSRVDTPLVRHGLHETHKGCNKAHSLKGDKNDQG